MTAIRWQAIAVAGVPILYMAACGAGAPPQPAADAVCFEDCTLIEEANSDAALAPLDVSVTTETTSAGADAADVPADVLPALVEGSPCAGPPCTGPGIVVGGQCMAAPFKTFRVTLYGDASPSSTCWYHAIGPARPDGSVLVLYRQGTSDIATSVTAKLISAAGEVAWSKSFDVPAESSDTQLFAAPSGESVVVFFRGAKDSQVYATAVDATGTVKMPVALDSQVQTYLSRMAACDDTYIAVANLPKLAWSGQPQVRYQLVGFGFDGQVKWATAPFEQEGFGLEYILSTAFLQCRPQGGAYWQNAEHLFAFNSSGSLLWKVVVEAYPPNGWNQSEKWASWSIARIHPDLVVTQSHGTKSWAAKYWSNSGKLGKVVEVPVGTRFIPMQAPESGFLAKSYANIAGETIKFGDPIVRTYLARHSSPGELSWARDFAPWVAGGGYGPIGEGPTPAPGGGWDFSACTAVKGQEGNYKFELLRLDHLGRLECNVDKCAGIKTLNACDDGDPTTLDWCKQTEGCTHLKVK